MCALHTLFQQQTKVDVEWCHSDNDTVNFLHIYMYGHVWTCRSSDCTFRSSTLSAKVGSREVPRVCTTQFAKVFSALLVN
jgi:hypothetical protein